MRRLGIVLTTVLVASVMAAPAHAAKPASPQRFTGYAFDTCVSPSDATMDAWNVASPYAVVGIYTSGNSRYCDDAKQPHLSPAWVQRQANHGWLFMPIHVGYQAPCFDSRSKKHRMSYAHATARAQAVGDANEAVSRAKRFGFAKGNAVYLDIEFYDRTNRRCDAAVLTFVDAFVTRVHRLGYKVGLYSSGSAAIQSVDAARLAQRKGFVFPDQMWFAWTNQRADTDGRPYLSNRYWKRDRVHQFHNNVTLSYAGQRVTIDKNIVDVGGGSRARKEQKVCTMSPTLPRYRGLKAGSRGKDVRLLQCLLRRSGHQATVTGRWNARTTRAVNSYRTALGWPKNGAASRPLWTALLSRGTTPIALKRGKVGEPVHRLQRALRASGQKVNVTGIYDARTTVAVRSYRAKMRLPAYQTADARVWGALQSGRR